jgi:3-hydroxybutyryl-CoA dehydrogenase
LSLTFSNIAVLGAGTMGTGIAQVCAEAGGHVILFEASSDALKHALKTIEKDLKKAVENGRLSKLETDNILARIKTTRMLDDCEGSELVIEAVYERLDVKQDLFSQLDAMLPPPAIFATNTGSLSITAIAAKTRFPERVCGMHFFNPPLQKKLVEMVSTHATDPEAIAKCCQFVTEIGKEAVTVTDSAGFIVNRMTRPFFCEALRCLSEGVADAATIDEIMREGGSFESGPFEQMDRIGIDTNYAITRAIWEASFHDSRYRPHPLQKKMMEAGQLGIKSGHGFYEYPDA